MPVWNASGPASRSWEQVELAVSTYWPNFYQVRKQRLQREGDEAAFVGSQKSLKLFK